MLASEQKQLCIDALSKLSQGMSFTVKDIELIAELPDSHSPSTQFFSILRKEALKLKTNPVLSLLEHSKLDGKLEKLGSVFKKAEDCNNLKV